jgi:hypothetical protein
MKKWGRTGTKRQNKKELNSTEVQTEGNKDAREERG